MYPCEKFVINYYNNINVICQSLKVKNLKIYLNI